MTSLFAGVHTVFGLPMLTSAADVTLCCSSVRYNLLFGLEKSLLRLREELYFYCTLLTRKFLGRKIKQVDTFIVLT